MAFFKVYEKHHENIKGEPGPWRGFLPSRVSKILIVFTMCVMSKCTFFKKKGVKKKKGERDFNQFFPSPIGEMEIRLPHNFFGDNTHYFNQGSLTSIITRDPLYKTNTTVQSNFLQV